jgi:hypothetical protein
VKLPRIKNERHVGQYWCSPTSYRESNGTPYPTNVAVKTNQGWLLLCDMWEDTKTGERSITPVIETTIPKVEI